VILKVVEKMKWPKPFKAFVSYLHYALQFSLLDESIQKSKDVIFIFGI